MKVNSKQTSQININLIPREGLTGPLGRVLPSIIGVGKALTISIELILIAILFSNIKFNIDKNNLKNSIQAKANLIQNQSKIEAEIKAFQNKLDNIAILKRAQTNMGLILGELEKKLPSDVTLTELKVEGSLISLSGSLKTTQGLQALITSLRESKQIKNLEISQLTIPTPQAPFYTFTATANLERGARE